MMVFTKLSVQEKDAFFGLLDEYFQSRPEIFGQNGTSGLAGTGISTTAAASVVQRALAANATTGSHASAPKSNTNPFATSMHNVNVGEAMTVGRRVAAASLAFSGGAPPSAPSRIAHATSTDPPPPPSLPRRTSPNAPATAAALADYAAPGVPGSEVDKLVTKKASVLSAFKKPGAAGGVTIPPAFVAPRNAYGPPPVRRATSETNAGSTGTGGAGAQRLASAPLPAAPGVADGEWAEVVYDYRSEDPGDLAIDAGTRVFVTAKSSDDWWTGQIEGQGREGLFPASYVKLL